MIHNAKAAMWKLQEVRNACFIIMNDLWALFWLVSYMFSFPFQLHVVNKLLAKQVEESKQQVSFLEEGFQNLQESLRSTVHESLESETQLRERLAVLQTIVDSLTGPVIDGGGQSQHGDEKSRVFLPIRGNMDDESPKMAASIDPASSKSKARCLILRPRLKKKRRTPAAGFVRCHGKYTRRSITTGTALAGAQRKNLVKASRAGCQLLPPRYFSNEDNDDWSFY
jgi:hypothetical protein